MADINHEKKKTGSTRRIMKWMALGLLTLFIVLALIVQAPWKIITLLAIILAGCTVLPRQMRKWFWFGVGAVVLILIIWVFLPEENSGWRPYTFDEGLAALEAKYVIPNEENAALAYDEIFDTLDTDSNQPEFFLISRPSSKDEPWLSKDHPEMAEWLKGHQNTIAKLMQAAQKGKCHFSIPADGWDLGRHMERLAPMRQCAFLLLSAANNDIAEGRIDAGLEKYLCTIRMADHLYRQPVTTDILAGSALERLAVTQLNKFVIEGEPTVEQLQFISDSTGDLNNNWGSIFKKVLELDKLFVKNTVCDLLYEANPERKVRLSRDPIASFRAAHPQELPTPTYWQMKSEKAKTILAWLSLPATPQKAAEILDASFDRYDAMAEPDFDWAKQRHKLDSFFTKEHLYRIRLNFRYFARFLVDMSEETYFGLHDAYSRSLAVRRGSRALIAVKQYRNEHGAWPDDLDAIKRNIPAEALIDPQNNGSFVYKLTGEAFTFYSKGKNNVDEDGQYESGSEKGLDDWSIWPPRGHKIQGEDGRNE